MAKEDGMIEFKKKESQEKEKSVKDAVEELEKKHKPISVVSVSAVAAVSRSFIYNHEQLRDMINEKRTQPLKSIKNPSKKEKTLVETLYEINHNLSVENEKLKKENSNLKKNSYKEKYEAVCLDYKNCQEEYRALYALYTEMAKRENMKTLPKIGGTLSSMKN